MQSFQSPPRTCAIGTPVLDCIARRRVDLDHSPKANGPAQAASRGACLPFEVKTCRKSCSVENSVIEAGRVRASTRDRMSYGLDVLGISAMGRTDAVVLGASHWR